MVCLYGAGGPAAATYLEADDAGFARPFSPGDVGAQIPLALDRGAQPIASDISWQCYQRLARLMADDAYSYLLLRLVASTALRKAATTQFIRFPPSLCPLWPGNPPTLAPSVGGNHNLNHNLTLYFITLSPV